MNPDAIIKIVGVPLRLSYTILCGLVDQGAIDRARMAAFLVACYNELPDAERLGTYGQVLKRVSDDVAGSGPLNPSKITLH